MAAQTALYSAAMMVLTRALSRVDLMAAETERVKAERSADGSAEQTATSKALSRALSMAASLESVKVGLRVSLMDLLLVGSTAASRAVY